MNCKPTPAQRQQWNAEENKDVVILHQTKRTPFSPAIAPFAMKLETFLRMHEIKYKSDFDVPGHPTTCKTPWITLNGEDVADSELCTQHIIEKLNVTPKKDISKPEDKVLYRGLRSILHDHLYFCLLTERYLYSKAEDVAKFLAAVSTASSPIQFLNKFFINRTVKMVENQVKAQGVGRMTKEQVYQSAKEDLETLSLALGSQRYFFGDEPSELDCSAFGLLSYALYHPEGEGGSATEIRHMVQGLENLAAFAERMRDQFWPDWDELCKKAAAEENQPKKGKKPSSGGKAEEKKCNGDESEQKKEADGQKKEKADDDKAKQEETKDDKKESD